MLCCNRDAVKHFGRIPKIIHTDHARIVRQVDLPLGRIDPMEYRWMVELQQGGSLLLYRLGTSQAHHGPDGLSRNPPGTSQLVLARKRDWISFRAAVKGIQAALQEEEDEDKLLEPTSAADEEEYDEDVFDKLATLS